MFLASTVARTDNLEFLSDLVPQTTTWKAHKAKKQREATTTGQVSITESLPAGQMTLDGRRPPSNPAEISILSNASGPAAPTTNGSTYKGGDPSLEFRHYDPVTNGNGQSQFDDSDVKMD